MSKCFCHFNGFEVKDANARKRVADIEKEQNVLESRMNNFTMLPEGEGTAENAELLDIRVGYEGEIYENAGAAVRGQYEKLHDAVKKSVGFIGCSPEVKDLYSGNFSEMGTNICNVVERLKVLRGSVINKIEVRSHVAGTVHIGLFRKTETTLTPILLISKETVSYGINTFDVDIEVPEDSYVGFLIDTAGAVSLRQTTDANDLLWQIKEVTQLSLNADYAISSTYNYCIYCVNVYCKENLSDSFEALKSDLEATKEDIYMNDQNPEKRDLTAGSWTEMGTNICNVVERLKVLRGSVINKIEVRSHVAGTVHIGLFRKTETTLTPILLISKETVSYGINTFDVDIEVPEDSYVGFLIDTNGTTAFNVTPTEGKDVLRQIKEVTQLSLNTDYAISSTYTACVYGANVYCETKLPKVIEEVKKYLVKDFANLKYMCFGDSIISDGFCGIGTKINNELGSQMIKNFAKGGATASDWHIDGVKQTTVSFGAVDNTKTPINVLSNQVYSALRHTTASGQKIKWNHPINGEFSLDETIGTGQGNVTDIPDIIFISISTNDGCTWDANNNATTIPVDDTETVLSQSYPNLTKNSIASGLRWAIETLQSAYPDASIFVSSPLQTDRSMAASYPEAFSISAGMLKRKIIEEVCTYCSVNYIDGFGRSGYSMLISDDNSGLHPNEKYRNKIAKFYANKIKNDYC